jgi:hypothetical protein
MFSRFPPYHLGRDGMRSVIADWSTPRRMCYRHLSRTGCAKYLKMAPLPLCALACFVIQVTTANRRRRKAVPKQSVWKDLVETRSMRASANRSQPTLKTRLSFLCLNCAYTTGLGLRTIVVLRPPRSSHAKRKPHSLFTSSRTRCLGVPLEGILFRSKEKASQNRHRIARYPQR